MSSLDLAVKYRWDAQYLSAGHYLAAKRYQTTHVSLGIATIAATSITTTSVFASSAQSPSTSWRVATGLLAAAAATFASLQTFLKLADRADRHKVFGARFIDVRDTADELLIRLSTVSDRQSDTLLEEVRAMGKMLTDAAREAPDLSNFDYNRARSGFPRASTES